jgi:hypothetical protein
VDSFAPAGGNRSTFHHNAFESVHFRRAADLR